MDRVSSPIGDIVIASRGDRVCALEFADCADVMDRLLRRRFGPYQKVAQPGPRAIKARLRAYFTGELNAIDGIQLDTGGTPFQGKVWSVLRRIPPETTATYGDLARRLKVPNAYRAVGHANGANPVAIVVPCHRLISSAGQLTGYTGGLDLKLWLLAHEGADLSNIAG